MTSLLKIGNLFSKLSIAPGRLTNSYSTSASSFGLMKCLMPNSTRPLVSTVGQFVASKCVSNSVGGSSSIPSRNYETYSFTEHLSGYLKRRIKNGLPKVGRKRNSPTEGQPFLKGIVLKTLIKKPKKPNSANRKCVRVRLSTGREATAYVPGIGHNLQEHHIVLVRGGKMQDLPGVKLKCVRGKYDLQHVKKQS